MPISVATELDGFGPTTTELTPEMPYKRPNIAVSTAPQTSSSLSGNAPSDRCQRGRTPFLQPYTINKRIELDKELSRVIMTDSEVEIEPYEEVIGDLNYSTPPRSRSVRPTVCEQETSDSPTFNGPMQFARTNSCARSSRSDLRYLAGNPNMPRAVGKAILTPNVGLELNDRGTVTYLTGASYDVTDTARPAEIRETGMVCVQDPAYNTNVRSYSALVMKKKSLASCGPSDNRPRSAPVSWMAAVTARVNALWDAFNHRPSIMHRY